MTIIEFIFTMTVVIGALFIVIHFWVMVCDCIVAGLKKLFHIGKKETVNWHSLDNDSQKKK